MLIVAVLALIATRAGATPDELIKTQTVELLEVVKPGVFTQRSVRIQFMTDATAAVCVRGLDAKKDISRAKCFYRMHGSTEVIVMDMQLMGEAAT